MTKSLKRDQLYRTHLDDYAEKWQEFFAFKREDGILEVRMHSEGGACRWDLELHRAFIPAFADVHHDPETVILPLSMLSASHGGIDVTPDRVAEVVRFVRDNVQPPRAPLEHHPMRSVWWMVPFAACVSGEWWLRRRQGKR